MRRYTGAKSPILIQFHIFWIVDGMEFEGIHCYQYRPDVCVDVAAYETDSKVFQERVFVEIWELTEIWVVPIFGLVQEALEEVLDELGVHAEGVGPEGVV